MSVIHKYAGVALAVPLRASFTYRVPDELDRWVVPGAAVDVMFGRRRMTGIVLERSEKPESLPVESIRDLLDVRSTRPFFEPRLLELLKWAAAYYIEPVGDMLRAALPPGLFTDSGTFLSLTDRGPAEGLDGDRAGLLGFVRDRGGARLSHAAAKSGVRFPRLQASLLCDGGLLRCTQGRPPKSGRVLTLSGDVPEETLLQLNSKSRRTAELLELLIMRGSVSLDELESRFKGAGEKVKKLCGMGLASVTLWDEGGGGRDGGRGAQKAVQLDGVHGSGVVLSQPQSSAIDWICKRLGAGFAAALLHGVTGSGKTEVYIRAASKALEQGRGVVFLVPEISLTPQLAGRLRSRFGGEIAVLHSGLKDADRLAEWQAVSKGLRRVVLGTRSAVFAPVKDLGLVVVDEEHDAAFKQEESPRYNGRDLAIKRAQMLGAVVVLGSATPSVESYFNTSSGKSMLLELPERVTGHDLPRVDVVDLGELKKSPREKTGPVTGGEAEDPFFISPALREGLTRALDDGGQAILLLNRRGFSSFVICSDCGYQFMCTHCSVSMTYHRKRRSFICHYCGRAVAEPSICPQCGHGALKMFGLGTERVESEVKKAVPAARVMRLDRDVVSDIGEAERILETFEAGGADVLVGTQMVAKGHHFPWVTFVGIVIADIGLSLPDFRGGERLFSLLTQVAGRSGRGTQKGSVLIQTFNPLHYSILAAKSHDYAMFYSTEIEARRELDYPPFSRLVRLVFEAGTPERALSAAADWASALEKIGGADLEVMGPAPAVLSRLKDSHRCQVLVKGGRTLPKAKKMIGEMVTFERKSHHIPGVRVVVDVDPMAML